MKCLRIKDIIISDNQEKAPIGTNPYIEIGDIDVNNKTYQYKDKESVSGAKYALQDSIIVSTVRPTRGAISIIKEQKVAVSNAFAIINVDKEKCNYKYLFYMINNRKFYDYLGVHSKGATYPTCSKDDVYNYEILLPSLNEQSKIVDIFDNVSNCITIKNKQIDYLNQLVKSQFVEMFGDPKFNDKCWEKSNMGDYMTVLTDFSSNGSYKTLDSTVKMYDEPNYAYMVRTTDLENNDYKNNAKYISEDAYNFLAKSKVYPKDIIMNKIGSAGKVYIMPDVGMPVSLGRNAFLFRYNEKINPTFIYYLLTSDYGINEISQYVRGAVTKTITKDDARHIKIIVPPIELQNKFAKFVEHVDKQKFKSEKQLEKLKELQESLVKEYFG